MARPPKYTPEKLEKSLEKYFAGKEEEKKERKLVYMSIYDVCTFLDISRDTWERYEKKPGYAGIIKRARAKIINNWMPNLFFPGRNVAGAIFYLKNVAGMSDSVIHRLQGKVEHEHTHKLDELPLEQLVQLNAALDALEQPIIDVTPGQKEKT